MILFLVLWIFRLEEDAVLFRVGGCVNPAAKLAVVGQ